MSRNGTFTLKFIQAVRAIWLELRLTLPTLVQKDPDGDKDNGLDPNNSDNGDDDGQGHQFVINIAGHAYLYTLSRANGHIDVDDLYIHELSPTAALPLNGAPAMNDGPPAEVASAGTRTRPIHRIRRIDGPGSREQAGGG